MIKSKFFFRTEPVLTLANLVPIFAPKFLPNTFFQDSVLVPIPIHWSRYCQRGFNQAELIAKNLSSQFHTPVVNLLTRTKKTLLQANLTAENREQNLLDAFSVNFSELSQISKDTHIILVDDLITTGSTLISATKCIRNHFKAAKISGLALCIGD